jgi:hypothetical protein
MEEIGQQEVGEIQQIIYEFFLKEYGSERKAEIMLGKLASFVQDPGVRLIHFGNTVFMMILVKPRVAEIHTMATDETISSLAKNFVLLSDFLKNIGVREWYSYSEEPVYKIVAQKTKLPLELEELKTESGKTLTVYRMRFE